jgi:predicted alpha/beta hydrolase family esterase
MQRNVLIFHGTGGSPEGNWFPWLKKELEAKDCSVFVPKFPHPKEHKLDAWLKVLEGYEKKIDGDAVLIGHSLGGLFLLRVLERLKHPVCAAFFVATSIGVKPIKYYDSDFAFSGFSFDWKEIRKKSRNFFVYHSNDDPYVSLANGKELARQLNVELTFIPNAGHINAESGYTKFDLILKDLEKVV